LLCTVAPSIAARFGPFGGACRLEPDHHLRERQRGTGILNHELYVGRLLRRDARNEVAEDPFNDRRFGWLDVFVYPDELRSWSRDDRSDLHTGTPPRRGDGPPAPHPFHHPLAVVSDADFARHEELVD